MAGCFRSSGCGKGRRAGFVRVALAVAFVLCGLLPAMCWLSALSDVVLAQEKKKKTGLKWKDYRDPEKAIFAYDPNKDRTVSEEFIRWDMKGFKSQILDDEPDLPKRILEIGEELNKDPVLIVAHLHMTKYEKQCDYSPIIKSPWRCNAPNDAPQEKIYIDEGGRKVRKFDTWAEGIKVSWARSSSQDRVTESFPEGAGKLVCNIAVQIQTLDEYLDKKTKGKKEYDVKIWKPLWDKVKKETK
ncbi:MAG: hypothetical protein AB1696_00460 [Planctomycetota bacterium]